MDYEAAMNIYTCFKLSALSMYQFSDYKIFPIQESVIDLMLKHIIWFCVMDN